MIRKINFQSGASKAVVLLISRIVVALVGVVFVPVYIRLIGVESFGLVAFYSTLAGALLVLDLGLSTAISRQLAIKGVDDSDPQESKDLVFSIEIIYWVIAIVIGGLIILFARDIAVYWVRSEGLSAESIRRAVMLMGILFAFQWPMSIYNGVLVGLNRQIASAVIAALLAATKAIGIIVVLKYISASVEMYFVWQAVITLIFTLVLRQLVKNALPRTNTPVKFSTKQLKVIWRFTAGMAGISIVTFFISQIDKIVVSKMVLLTFVGYYTLAFTLATVLSQIISPLQPVVFPKFSALVAKKDHEGLVNLYHRSCRWVSIIVLPLGLGMFFFAKEILLIWTRNPELTEHTGPVLKVFAVGTVCNCLMWMPYTYMLAKGITRFTIYQNLIAAIILVPLLFWWTKTYGILGASFVWLVVNAGYVIISLPLMHRFYINGQLKKWYLDDFIIIFIIAFCIIFLLKQLSIYFLGGSLNLFSISVLFGAGGLVYVLMIRETRQILKSYFNKTIFTRSK